MSSDEALQTEFENEFEDLVSYVTMIDAKTELAFNGMNTIARQDIVEALI